MAYLSAKSRYRISWLAAVVCMPMVFGCSSKASDPELEIRQFLETGEAAVEARELGAVANMISEEYADPGGRSRRDLVRMVAGYLLRNESVHLLIRVESISVTGEAAATARVYAGMTGRLVGGTDSLSDFRADLYRFDLELAKEGGDWKLTGAEWRRAEQQDLLDEIMR